MMCQLSTARATSGGGDLLPRILSKEQASRVILGVSPNIWKVGGDDCILLLSISDGWETLVNIFFSDEDSNTIMPEWEWDYYIVITNFCRSSFLV